MKLFIDSADVDEIKEVMAYGIVSGVTTNPSLLKKSVEKKLKEATVESLESYIRELLAAVGKGKDVSLEVTKGSSESMFKQGILLYEKFNKEHGNVVIKVPVSPYLSAGDYEGIKTVAMLSEKNIRTNVTLIFSLNQALLAAEAGATYVSPFVGRIDDVLRKMAGKKDGENEYFPLHGVKKKDKDGIHEFIVQMPDEGIFSGMDLVEKIVKMYQAQGRKTRVLAASIRHPRQVAEAASVGAHIATLPRKIFDNLLVHELTEKGMGKFESDCPQVYRDLFNKA